MTTGGLFEGIGGFPLAATWAGIEPIWSNEIDPWCCKVLRKNFNHEIIEKDIRDLIVDNDGNLMYLCENGDIMGRKKLTKYNETVSLYESGLSIQECAEFYEISRQAMHKILKRRGCKFRSNLKFGEDNHFHRGSYPNNDKKKRVQHLTEKAIKKGILIRPVKCSKCNNTQEFKDGRNGIQAHHCDYDKPLEVEWLCQKCHHNWHKENKVLNEKNEKGNPPVDILTGGFP